MRIIPAIDIIDGKCVRLSQGDYDTKKIYNENPLEVAKEFEDHGIEYLHLVDLDGAKSKQIINYKTLELLLKLILKLILVVELNRMMISELLLNVVQIKLQVEVSQYKIQLFLKNGFLNTEVKKLFWVLMQKTEKLQLTVG